MIQKNQKLSQHDLLKQPIKDAANDHEDASSMHTSLKSDEILELSHEDLVQITGGYHNPGRCYPP
jgi:hypothetical protein